MHFYVKILAKYYMDVSLTITMTDQNARLNCEFKKC